MLDVVIIGAGIIGSSIAHQLSKYELNVLVLEKETEVSDGVTKANSAIIHAGNDNKPGTLKAKLNVRGNKLMEELCKELRVDYQKIGSITVAFSDDQVKTIYERHERAKLNGVETYILTGEEVRKKEPNIKEDVKLGLYAPTTGIVAPWDVVYALTENAVHNGVDVHVQEAVIDIKKEADGFTVITDKGSYKTRYVINCAGLFAEHITRMVTEDPGFKTRPTRGQYYVLDRDVDGYVNHVIYPTPTALGKGVLVVPTVHGNILLGPTAEGIDDVEHNETTRDGFTLIRNHLDTMVKNIPYRSNIRTFSGVRPKTDRGDFIIEEVKGVENFIQCSGIESPGLASSQAIAEYVLELLKEKEEFTVKSNYEIYRQNTLILKELNEIERNALIQKNPLYGRIICRCEQISEGEIVDAIRRPCGARTIDGVKRRARPGAGRCQGGYCQPEVLKILARELNIDPMEVLMDKPNSNVLMKRTKEGESIE